MFYMKTHWLCNTIISSKQVIVSGLTSLILLFLNKVTLILDSVPTTDVVFACYLRMAVNSEHARELAKNPICKMPNDIIPTSVPDGKQSLGFLHMG